VRKDGEKEEWRKGGREGRIEGREGKDRGRQGRTWDERESIDLGQCASCPLLLPQGSG